MKAPTRIRTADVLAVFDGATEPLRQQEIAARLGEPARAISGHLSFLAAVGKLQRVRRGYWIRTPHAEART